MAVAFLCVFIVVAAVQLVKPRLLWRANRPGAGHSLERAVGVVVLVGAVIMLVAELT
ncbi:hypothetical protein GKQ77_15120 [Streptomyces sp. BG9H]|uniref:Uncharacterized protein n=1 Tax=Streptomyces anatolicus TaxID=2675858 RepID=A0ABS6YP63_9ACTN|nr:hypothetical protein [Streptomyces anatolicus]MBW5422880.1 hypothetical protein [Streptomyces anatolicus]